MYLVNTLLFRLVTNSVNLGLHIIYNLIQCRDEDDRLFTAENYIELNPIAVYTYLKMLYVLLTHVNNNNKLDGRLHPAALEMHSNTVMKMHFIS